MPGDPAADLSTSVQSDEAVRWLLRTNRLYRRSGEFRRQDTFAAALKSRSASMISRWEQGTKPAAPIEVVRGYENVLGIPPGQLTTLVATLRGAEHLESRPGDRAETQQLLENALTGEPLTGADWGRLIRSLLEPGPSMMRRSDWLILADRLVHETAVSCHWPYWQRSSALGRLCTHPEGGDAVTATVAGLLADPDCQVLMDPAALLAQVGGPAAGRTLGRQIEEPTGEHALRAVLVTWAIVVAERPVSDECCRRLLRLAWEYLQEDGLQLATRTAAADLVAVLASKSGVPLPRAGLARELRPTVTRRLCVPYDDAVAVHRGLLDAADDVVVVDHEEDPLLPRLLFQAVFSTNIDTRVRAGSLLGASPFRTAVATALADLLAAERDRSPALAAGIVSALGVFGDAEHRSAMESVLATAEPALAGATAMMLGHLPGTTPTENWHDVLTRHADNDFVTRAVYYGAGMNGDIAFLDSVADNASARWWRRLADTVTPWSRT